MANEIREAPAALLVQERALTVPLRDLVKRLRHRPPRVVVTCARGSSACAALFAKHSIERHLGIPVAEAAPSMTTIYRRALQLDGQLFLAISQSGESDDLIEQTEAARASGALTVGLINATASPLAQFCDIVLPMSAGPEISVAATKSFVATLTAILRLTALWSADDALPRALAYLPKRLSDALACDWSVSAEAFKNAGSMMTIGRGPTFAIAKEAALKLKETCHIHAEGFSGAEFQHGPITLAGPGYPILIFMPSDGAAGALQSLAGELRRKGTALFVAEPGDAAEDRLPVPASDHPETDAVCMIQSFYALAVSLAAARGQDADKPLNLQKITRTR